MAVTVSFYNHTPKRIVAGEFPVTNTYKINLYSALPFNATATTKTAAESGGTQLATANGYTQDGKVIANLVASIVTTNDGSLTFDPVDWDATGSGIAAGYALIYDDTTVNDPPYAHVDFGGTVTAIAATKFRISPNASGFLNIVNAA